MIHDHILSISLAVGRDIELKLRSLYIPTNGRGTEMCFAYFRICSFLQDTKAFVGNLHPYS